jgi:hypothetical protein
MRKLLALTMLSAATLTFPAQGRAPAPLPQRKQAQSLQDMTGWWDLRIGAVTSKSHYRVMLHADGSYQAWSSYDRGCPAATFSGTWERRGDVIAVWEWHRSVPQSQRRVRDYPDWESVPGREHTPFLATYMAHHHLERPD